MVPGRSGLEAWPCTHIGPNCDVTCVHDCCSHDERVSALAQHVSSSSPSPTAGMRRKTHHYFSRYFLGVPSRRTVAYSTRRHACTLNCRRHGCHTQTDRQLTRWPTSELGAWTFRTNECRERPARQRAMVTDENIASVTCNVETSFCVDISNLLLACITSSLNQKNTRLLRRSETTRK